MCQATCRPLNGANVNANSLWIAILNDLPKKRPLLFFNLASVGPVIEIVRVGARDVNPFDASLLAPIVEDQYLKDRIPGVHGNQGGENRVEIVFLADDEPHVKPSFAHDHGQNCIKPFLQNAVDHLTALPHGKNQRG